SQTPTEKVRTTTGQALKGATAGADSAPATIAMAARFHPQARMIERPAARSLLTLFTANRLHRRAVTAARCRWPAGHWRQGLLRGAGFRAGCAAPGVPCG